LRRGPAAAGPGLVPLLDRAREFPGIAYPRESKLLAAKGARRGG
jgi:hypothetical protein